MKFFMSNQEENPGQTQDTVYVSLGLGEASVYPEKSWRRLLGEGGPQVSA